MLNDSVNNLEQRICALENELEQAQAREAYFQEIAKQAGRKRLLETRELSQLVSEHRAAQEMLSENSAKLEKLVQERTKELKKTNQHLRRTIQKQKTIQKQLERLVELDHAILDISSAFINQPVEKIDKGIIQALEKMGHFSDSHRISLYILAHEGNSILCTHDWRKRKHNEHEEHFHDHYFDIYLEELRNSRDINITTMHDLATLIHQSVSSIPAELFQSLLAVPMMQRGQIYGALVLYGERGKTTKWPEELITFVKIMSDLFVSALDRKVTNLAQRESDERYRDLVEKAGLAITMEAADGSFHYFNRHFADLFGYSEQEITGLNIANLVHPDDVDMVMRFHRNRFHNKQAPTRYEFRGITKNGETIYLEVDIVGLKMKNQLMATRSYIWDITHRVLAERAIQESEARYRSLVENFLDIVLIADYEGNIFYTNPVFKKQTGYAVEELDTMQRKLELFPDDADKTVRLVQDFIESDEQHSAPFENQLCSRDGRMMFFSIIISKIAYANQPMLQFIAHNITDQKIAESAIKKSADFERTVSEILSQFVGSEITDTCIQNTLQTIGEWSNAGRASVYRILEGGTFLSSIYEWCGTSVKPQVKKRQNILVEHLDQWDAILEEKGFIHVPDTAKLPANLRSEKIISASRDIKSFLFIPFRIRNKLYGAISIEDTEKADRWADDDIKLLRLSSEIISSAFERIEAEKMLKRSEAQYRTLFDSSNDEIYVYALKAGLQPGNYINVNNAACTRLGYSKDELLCKSIFDIEAHDNLGKTRAFLERIVRKNHHIFETTHVTKDGLRYPVEVSSHLLELEGQTVVMSIARDITERKRIEEEVQKSQRLESIGVLAGGIAHDFNNLLSIILGNAQLARMMSAQNKDISRFLQNIEQGASQASTLTQQLLTFSKGGAPIREVYPIDTLIKNAVQLALSGLDEHAVYDISTDLYSAKIDRGQIRQVIHNLILNSAQAMPSGGAIGVSAKNVHSKNFRRLQHLNPGPYVQISIKDNGVGIPKNELPKIFDPYYTTKKNGSGLGLTVAYSIIKKHDGLLVVDSKPGKGTIVHIYLPAVIQKWDKVSTAQPQIDAYKGSVMIMDDEELVLEVAEEMLRQLGFRVQRSKNGEELLEIYEQAVQSKTKPDFVLMDLTVSAGMGGVEAMRKLLKLDPEVKAIVSSGYSNDEIMSNYPKYGFAGVVAKPYTLDDIERVIARVLKT
ncbi:PAS domain S-box protein [candidate division KSB1 bacterium]|nr:PAS domain S-box protein [candidate division KSB1 bacterium]RQW00598.1 MAG: PAS domain S-box protein [candidate division KSB1 bacterium]